MADFITIRAKEMLTDEVCSTLSFEHWLNLSWFDSKGNMAGASLKIPSYLQYFVGMDLAEGEISKRNPKI